MVNDTNPVVLTLYTRHNCALCEDMIYTLNDFSADLNFTVALVDIDVADMDASNSGQSDSGQSKAGQSKAGHGKAGKGLGIKQQYNDLVPVLKLGDEEICHHFFDRQALIQSLGAERTQS